VTTVFPGDVPLPEEGNGASPFSFTDKRRIDPETGEARGGGSRRLSGDETTAGPDRVVEPGSQGEPDRVFEPGSQGEPTVETPGGSADPDADLANAVNDAMAGLSLDDSADLAAAKAEAADHLESLQRERAAFTNFRNRSLRDQEAARVTGVESVLTALLPVLDDVARAQDAGDLTGPMAAIATKLDETLAKCGVERYGQVGEPFNPLWHEALMHREDAAKATELAAAYAAAQAAVAEATDQADAPSSGDVIEMVIQPGYRIGEKVARAARVGVVGMQ
jgi:molecular chaperone GrpE